MNYILTIIIFFIISSNSFAQESIFDRLKDSATHLELPSITEFTGAGTERAMNLASDTMVDLSSEFSRINPDLEMLGYRVANVQFQILPPSGHWCVVSTTKGSDREADKTKDGDSFTRTILQTAVTAKKIQKINGFDIIVINIYVGPSPNIRLSYYYIDEVAKLYDGDIHPDGVLCSYSQRK